MKNISIKALVLSLVLVLAVLASPGCEVINITTLPDTPEETTNPASEKLTVAEEKVPIDTGWTSPEQGGQAMALPSIADVVASVKPSVVAINTETVITIFNRSSTREGAGSGWIISEDGIIVTNNHVIEGASSITVILDDGRTFKVDLKTVATDPLTDLAVLKIDADNLPAVRVGDSSVLRVGDWVVAIGNSLGEGLRATQGIVSRQDVSIQVEDVQRLYGLIETDAAINPGNSGGPLVNLAGEVIGITSAKFSAFGVEATGYAISTEVGMPIIQQLINNGRAVHPWLGVSLYTVNQLAIREFDLSVEEGAFVVEVVRPSPANDGGLRREDVIIGFNGSEVETVEDLIQAIRAARVGQEVEIVYIRGGERITITATLIERP